MSTLDALRDIKKLAIGSPCYVQAIAIEKLAGEAARKLEGALKAWSEIPVVYQGRLGYDYNEKTGMFDVTHRGYGVLQTEDSEVAHAICMIINQLFYSECFVAVPPDSLEEGKRD